MGGGAGLLDWFEVGRILPICVCIFSCKGELKRHDTDDGAPNREVWTQIGRQR